MAVPSYGDPKIFNSDQETQFTNSGMLRSCGPMTFGSAWMDRDDVWIRQTWSASGGRWNMRTSKSKSTLACCSSTSWCSIMWIFTILRKFILHSNIRLRTKSFSPLVIGKQWDIVNQSHLTNLLIKSCPIGREALYDTKRSITKLLRVLSCKK